MLGYAVRRALWMLPTLAIIVTAAFFLVRLAPGGPFDAERALPPGVRASLEAAYGLDRPLHEQYVAYVDGLLHGDLGPSVRFRDETVSGLIRAGLPVSLTLGGLALFAAMLAGVPLGALAALRHNSAADHALTGIAALGIAVPVFVIAPCAVLVFAVGLHWLPAGGWEPGRPGDMVLPVTTLALPMLAYVARLTRGSVLEAVASPWALAARARGLRARDLVLLHLLPAALVPVVGYLGPAAASALTGSLVVETVFSIPGIGRHTVQAALNRDYLLVLGVVIVYATILLVANLLVDLAYAWLDPRIRTAVRR